MAAPSFLAHLEALRKMFLEILAIFAVLLIPGWIFSDDVLCWMQSAALKVLKRSNGGEFNLSYFSLMEPFMVELKTGMAMAVGVGMPLYFWRIWHFLAPALYGREKRVLLSGAFAAWFLFASGFALGFFGVMPLLVKFSMTFAREGLMPVIGLSNFISMAMGVSLAFGVMFELPLLLLLLCAADLVRIETLRKQRPVVLVVIMLLAAILTPPDIISQLMLGVPTYLLFELTLLFGKLIIKDKTVPAEDPDESTNDHKEAYSVPERSPDDGHDDYEHSFRHYRRRPQRRRPEVNLSKYKKRKQ